MNIIDCHTHTQFSMDSEADINSCIEKAVTLGLSAYAITDHCECNAWYTKEHYMSTENMDYFNYSADFEKSVSAVTELKEKYSKKINLICGVELGQATQEKEIAEMVNRDRRLDFIIGSLHQLKGEKDFYYIDYDNMTMEEIYNLLERYFTEVYEMCRLGCLDVLGHITYCLRYMKCRNNITPDISRFDDIIAETFRTLANNGKGIEINTSGIRQGFGDCFPSLKYVRLFKELGGEILSVGSDSHTPEDIGKNISEGIITAKNAGFSRLCYFMERKPHFINID
ncbi:MAG: histidinol-phosphatase HisJ family protein [Ruminococcus sp.]|nr:histidinol-phosphatase HisJ family protein [Ruminococcus sp.]